MRKTINAQHEGRGCIFGNPTCHFDERSLRGEISPFHRRDFSLRPKWQSLVADDVRIVGDMGRNYYVYIMTNRSRTFYVGMTNNLERRVFEHKHKLIGGFTKRYNIAQLAYCEVYNDVREAIAREKQIKDWRREKKIALIESANPKWRDLSEDWGE